MHDGSVGTLDRTVFHLRIERLLEEFDYLPSTAHRQARNDRMKAIGDGFAIPSVRAPSIQARGASLVPEPETELRRAQHGACELFHRQVIQARIGCDRPLGCRFWAIFDQVICAYILFPGRRGGYLSPGCRVARAAEAAGGSKMVIANAAVSSAPIGDEHDHTTLAIRPRVFIISNVRLLCDGLTLSLSHQPSLQVVGSADMTVKSTRMGELHPDVVLLDVGTPGGLDMPPILRQVLPDLKVVAIAVNDVEQEVFACAEARVSGFVSRNGSIQDLLAAIHCAVRNELVCPPRIAALLFGRVVTLRSERIGERVHGGLTRREHEIASQLIQGLSNKEIARQLRIQNATVKNHIHSILGKLEVRRRGEVAARINGGVLPHRQVPHAQDRHLHGVGVNLAAPLD